MIVPAATNVTVSAVRFCAKLRPDAVEFSVRAPIVVIGALSAIVPPVAPRLASDAALPTAPLNAIAPPVLTARPWPPAVVASTVPLNVIAAPPV